MEKSELSFEQYDFEEKDSVISFKVTTADRRLIVNVQPFYAFVVYEEDTTGTKYPGIGYFKFYTQDIDEWNEYYERLIKTAGKSYRLTVKDKQRLVGACHDQVKKHKN